MKILNEDKRSEYVAGGKRGKKEKTDGKTRYEKRLKSRFSSSTREYNRIDMDSLFRKNTLLVNIPVRGETDDYIVTFQFGKFLDIVREYIEKQDGQLDLRAIIRALIESFNRDDIFVRCSCPDFQYRHSYHLSAKGLIVGPKDDLGPGCKHIMLCLANTSWLIKVAAVIRNYIKYFEQHRQSEYQRIIYPAIYGKDYEEPIQLTIDDKNELDTDEDTIDTANMVRRMAGRFQKGNQYRFQRKPKEDDSEEQLDIDDISDDTSNQ